MQVSCKRSISRPTCEDAPRESSIWARELDLEAQSQNVKALHPLTSHSRKTSTPKPGAIDKKKILHLSGRSKQLHGSPFIPHAIDVH